MTQTLPDITVGSGTWVDLNTESGIAVGTKMSVTLKSSIQCRLYEGATPPALDSTDGINLTGPKYPYASATILAGSLKIWALSTQIGLNAKVSVQEL